MMKAPSVLMMRILCKLASTKGVGLDLMVSNFIEERSEYCALSDAARLNKKPRGTMRYHMGWETTKVGEGGWNPQGCSHDTEKTRRKHRYTKIGRHAVAVTIILGTKRVLFTEKLIFLPQFHCELNGIERARGMLSNIQGPTMTTGSNLFA